MVARLHFSPVVKLHPSHPSLQKGKKPNLQNETRKEIQPRAFSDEDYLQKDEDEASCNENDYVIECLEEALKAQKEKLGHDHASISRTLHSLALEYKARSRYEEAVSCLKEALELLSAKLSEEKVKPASEVSSDASTESDSSSDASTDFSTDSYSQHDASTNSSLLSSSGTESEASSLSIKRHQYTSNSIRRKIEITEEMSCLLSCIGNIHRTRAMYRDAVDCYMKSINLLVEAGHPGDSPRVRMMIRILKRVECRHQRSTVTESLPGSGSQVD